MSHGTLLERTASELVLGSAWMTFMLDQTLILGRLDANSGEAAVAAATSRAPGVRISFEDRSGEPAEWY